MPEVKRPLPKPDEDTQPFWEACRRRELRMQQCRQCGTFRFRPRPICPVCLSETAEWVLLSGLGTIYTFGVVQSDLIPAFRDDLPYVIALVDLDEGPRMTTRIVECLPEAVQIGMRVRVVFQDVGDFTLPYFRPV
jgi:uncharacterized OB-fold protein